jgi:hypothetical protein
MQLLVKKRSPYISIEADEMNGRSLRGCLKNNFSSNLPIAKKNSRLSSIHAVLCYDTYFSDSL